MQVALAGLKDRISLLVMDDMLKREINVMRPVIYLVLFTVLSSCVVAPRYDYLEGGQTVKQPGVSFVLPEGKPWSAISRSTYEAHFGRFGESKKETLVVYVTVYNIPQVASKQEFLELVKKGRAKEPETGRFEKIRNSEEINQERSETCVVHKAASKDFGVDARRGGEYSVYETYGMNCIHPGKPAVGIMVELSRKAPPENPYPGFDFMGANLLKSVTFGEF